MGTGRAHFNAFQKERLGWLGGGSSATIAAVDSDGTYSVIPYELAGGGDNAIKVLESTDAMTGLSTWYYLEFRQPLGFGSGAGTK
jgi:hypothetical protein